MMFIAEYGRAMLSVNNTIPWVDSDQELFGNFSFLLQMSFPQNSRTFPVKWEFKRLFLAVPAIMSFKQKKKPYFVPFFEIFVFTFVCTLLIKVRRQWYAICLLKAMSNSKQLSYFYFSKVYFSELFFLDWICQNCIFPNCVFQNCSFQSVPGFAASKLEW